MILTALPLSEAFVNEMVLLYNQVDMLIFVYGEDTFRVQEKIQQMKQAFREKFDASGMNLATFPSSESTKLDTPAVLQAVCSYPFLGSKRMVVIGGLFDQLKKADEAMWIDGFSRMPDTTIAVLWDVDSPSSIEKKKLFREFSGRAQIHQYVFPKLEGSALTKWVSQRLRARGGVIEPAALTELVMRVGSDLWQMSHEIEKLIGYAAGEIITHAMVDQMVRASFESKIFELMDALSKKQRARALALLDEERQAGSDDHYLLTMLGRQIRILLSVRACLDENSRISKQEIAQRIDVHPFVAQKALEQARLFSLMDLKHAHDRLFDFDRDLKSGRMTAPLAVDLVVDSFLD